MATAGAAAETKSALAERLTVGALIFSGICLVGTDHDSIQRTVVVGIAVIGTGLDGALDALIGIGIHTVSSFILGSVIVCIKFFDSFIAFYPGV